MSELTYLIVEDDLKQREALERAVAQLRPEWRLVGAVGDADSARQLIESEDPDLALVDIHLPGVDDIGWMSAYGGRPASIYVTGDPDLAVQAFEGEAIDYIVKPITLRRLRASLDRAVHRLAPTLGHGGAHHQEPADPEQEFLTISRGQDILVVRPDQILYLQADRKYTRVVTTRGEGILRTGISELCKRFPTASLVRIHRSIVVNLNYVASVRRNELGQLDVKIEGRSELLHASKPYHHLFRTY